MITDITLRKEARNKMKKGVDKLADAVKSTLGPAGRNACIRREAPPHIPLVTKDGVTVARTINLPDKVEDMGAQLVKMAAEKTAIIAGDGTTTSTLLAQIMISQGLDAMEDDSANPANIKKGIDKAVDIVVNALKNMSAPITDDNLVNIATIAANNDSEIGSIVAGAIRDTGKDGVIGLQASKTGETWFEPITGIHIDKGYIHPHFVTNPSKMTVEFDDALILFSERKISAFKDIRHLLELAISNKKPLLIIAEDVDGEALSVMLSSAREGGHKFCAIKQPGFGNMQQQMLDDIAVMTSGKVVEPMSGKSWPAVDGTYFGTATKVLVSSTKTVIIGPGAKKESIDKRIEEIRALIENSPSEVEKEKLKTLRLAKLTNGTGIIHVGGTTEVEIKEKLDRIDDAKCATYAAIAEGVVPGGGSAYVHARKSLPASFNTDKDEDTGLNIIRDAILSPICQIGLNAGYNMGKMESIIGIISSRDGFYGYNAKKDVCEDLFASGVIDPAKVSRVALENAASVASMFLTTECAIVPYDSGK